MDYRNQLCDGCGLALKETDDVVVCPVCGTPQHRSCYEENGGKCVHEAEHESGFVWHGEEIFAAQSSFVCPICGHSNEKSASECARCGQPFTADALHRQTPQQTQDPAVLTDRLFFDAPHGEDEMMPLDEESRRQIDFVLAQRMLQATPGMTDAQAQETLCGHPLRQVMTFISSKAMTYLKKFRALESGKKLGWNWAAFLFSPYWFFYRKLYKPGVVFFTLRMCVTLLVFSPVSKMNELLYNAGVAMRDGTLTQDLYDVFVKQITALAPPIYAAVGAVLLLAVAAGLLADRLYHNHINATLTAAKQLDSRDAFLVAFLKKSSVSPLAAALSYAALSILPNLVMSIFSIA